MSFSGKQHQGLKKTIKNQAFWPDLELADFCNACRIPNDLPEPTVTSHLVNAMITVNGLLDEYRQRQQDAGHDSLDKVPSEKVDVQSIQVTLYQRAVFCWGKATVLRDFPSIDRRNAAENQAKSSEETEDQYLQYAQDAINRFLSQRTVYVELI